MSLQFYTYLNFVSIFVLNVLKIKYINSVHKKFIVIILSNKFNYGRILLVYRWSTCFLQGKPEWMAYLKWRISKFPWFLQYLGAKYIVTFAFFWIKIFTKVDTCLSKLWYKLLNSFEVGGNKHILYMTTSSVSWVTADNIHRHFFS